MKFPDKDRHQLFIEPEGEFTNEMYMGGMSSSLPEDVHVYPGHEGDTSIAYEKRYNPYA